MDRLPLDEAPQVRTVYIDLLEEERGRFVFGIKHAEETKPLRWVLLARCVPPIGLGHGRHTNVLLLVDKIFAGESACETRTDAPLRQAYSINDVVSSPGRQMFEYHRLSGKRL